MNKKIFLIGIFLIAVSVSLTAISANPDVNVPDGFKVNDDLSVKNQKAQFLGMDAIQTIVVLENGTDNITLTTFEADHDMDMSPSGNSQAKNIKGKEGIYQNKDGRYIFIYKDQSQFVQIDSPTEKLIEEVIY